MGDTVTGEIGTTESKEAEAQAFLRYMTLDECKLLAPGTVCVEWKEKGVILAKGSGHEISTLMAADLIAKPKPIKGQGQGILRMTDGKDIPVTCEVLSNDKDGIVVRGPIADVQKMLDEDFSKAVAFQKSLQAAKASAVKPDGKVS